VPRDAIVMDPGFGFAKNARHSVELLARLGEIVTTVGVPVAVGASRKSFLASFAQRDDEVIPSERLGASIAAAIHAARAGARVVRAHDVRATRQAVDLDVELRRLAAPHRGVGPGAGA
jgi:dihydropteroate synthase